MSLDRVLHPQKNVLELDDADIEQFLKSRPFNSEHHGLEFKRDFPRKKNGQADHREFCRHVVGLSNAGGGVLVFGVEDAILDSSIEFPAYVSGTGDTPSLEDISGWITNSVRPQVYASARYFHVAGKRVWVIRVPKGTRPPYAVWDGDARTLLYALRTPGGITTLGPEEIRALYQNAIVEQANLVVEALRSAGGGGSTIEPRLERHQRTVASKVEDPESFGYLGFYLMPTSPVSVAVPEIKVFLERAKFEFAEWMRFAPSVEIAQDSASIGYFPSALKADVKSTERLTLYSDGLIAFDSLVDTFLEGDRALNPKWLAYELQRCLQLVRAFLVPRGVVDVVVVLDLKYLEGFAMEVYFRSHSETQRVNYVGARQPIRRTASLAEVNTHDGSLRNTVSPVVKDIMEEICRIFGLSTVPECVWGSDGTLSYVRGFESKR